MISMLEKSRHYIGKCVPLKYRFLLRFIVWEANTIPETLNVVKLRSNISVNSIWKNTTIQNSRNDMQRFSLDTYLNTITSMPKTYKHPKRQKKINFLWLTTQYTIMVIAILSEFMDLSVQLEKLPIYSPNASSYLYHLTSERFRQLFSSQTLVLTSSKRSQFTYSFEEISNFSEISKKLMNEEHQVSSLVRFNAVGMKDCVSHQFLLVWR